MNRKGATITGYILKEMADKFWDTLPQYSALERPQWSNGWLTAFKQRHHINQKLRHGESAGVDRMQLELDLAELRTFLSDYPLEEALAQEDARYNATVSQISTAIQALAELGRIEEAMPTESFLNPDAEAVNDTEEDIFKQIAQAHADGDCEPESGDEVAQVAPVSLSEALAGLATLRLYEEQQEDGSRDLIRSLNRLERELLGKRANQGTQTQIDSYFQS